MQGNGRPEVSRLDPDVRTFGEIDPEDYAKAFSTQEDDGLDLHVDPEAGPADDAEVDFGPTTGWRVARSLETLRMQVNARWPGRLKSSDGMIGDDRHCGAGADKPSDHCAHVRDGTVGVVTAFDVTYDRRPGMCDAHAVIEAIRRSRDPRVKYVISNARIASSYATGSAAAWEWRPYGGGNRHDKHAHLSVVAEKAGYDSTAPWTIE